MSLEKYDWRVLRVEVEDKGPGLTQADIDKIFQPYIQIQQGQYASSRGTGIGLSLCKEIIRLHGGKVLCRSTPDRGSVFGFEVPMKMGLMIENSASRPHPGRFAVQDVRPAQDAVQFQMDDLQVLVVDGE